MMYDFETEDVNESAYILILTLNGTNTSLYFLDEEHRDEIYPKSLTELMDYFKLKRNSSAYPIGFYPRDTQ